MSNQSDAEKYRRAQVTKILTVFKEMHGRDATSIQEVETWLGSPAGKAALSEHNNSDGKVNPW